MTNTSKFWVGALIVGGIGTGAIVENRQRLEMNAGTDVTAPVAYAAPATASPAPTRRQLPIPKRTGEPAAALAMTTDLVGLAKPLLQPGTDLTMASEGFSSREAFLATAYAAKNLSIPFVVLKDRVVAARMPLERAIRQLKPDANAKREAARAISEARSETARPSGS